MCVCEGRDVPHFCLALMTRTTAKTTRAMLMTSRSSRKKPTAEPMKIAWGRARRITEGWVGVWVEDEVGDGHRCEHCRDEHRWLQSLRTEEQREGTQVRVA